MGQRDHALEDLLQEYRWSMLAAGRGTGTVRQRVLHIRRLAMVNPDLLAVKTEHLEHFLAVRRRTLAPESRKALRNSFRSFYEWAVRSGRLEENPAERLQPIYVARVVGRRAPDGAVLASLELATLPEKAMILLGRLACLRLNEITTLHTDNREGDMLRILGKGEKTRLVPINPELAEVLDRLQMHQGSGYYFPGRWGSHMHKESVSKIIKRRLGYNPHSLRHAGATAAYRGTGDLRAVQELLGHASLATTQRYIHVEVDQVRAAANATSIGTPPHKPSPVERITFAPVSSVSGGRE